MFPVVEYPPRLGEKKKNKQIIRLIIKQLVIGTIGVVEFQRVEASLASFLRPQEITGK